MCRPRLKVCQRLLSLFPFPQHRPLPSPSAPPSARFVWSRLVSTRLVSFPLVWLRNGEGAVTTRGARAFFPKVSTRSSPLLRWLLVYLTSWAGLPACPSVCPSVRLSVPCPSPRALQDAVPLTRASPWSVMEHRQPAPPSAAQHTTGHRGAKPYGVVDLPWQALTTSSSSSARAPHRQPQYAPPAGPFSAFPFLSDTGAAPNAAVAAMSQARRQRAEVSYQQQRLCQSNPAQPSPAPTAHPSSSPALSCPALSCL